MTTPLLVHAYQFGDLAWNARDNTTGVEWIVETDNDWWRAPARRIFHQDHPWGDGAARSRSRGAVRSMTFEGACIAPTLAARDQLLADWASLLADGELVQLVGPAPDGQYSLMVEYASAPEPIPINSHAFRWQVTLLAPDPVKLSVVEHTTGALELPSSSGGLTFPITFPVTFDAVVASGTALLTNSGSVPTGLTIRIDGPAPQPRVTLARGSDVQTLRLDLTVDAGQWLTIDTKAHTVVLNDTVSRRGRAAGVFPTLAPGTSELSWSTDTYEPDARLTATWRDARY